MVYPKNVSSCTSLFASPSILVAKSILYSSKVAGISKINTLISFENTVQ